MKFFLERMSDPLVRQIFETLDRFFRSRKMLFDMQFFDVTIASAVTGQLYAHTLGAVPKDIIQTRILGTGAVTFNYADFTDKFVSLTTTGPCQVRFFAGTYKEEG